MTVLCLSQVLSECFVLFHWGHLLRCISLRLYAFCLLVDLVRLSVTVQVIDWKDLSVKLPIIC